MSDAIAIAKSGEHHHAHHFNSAEEEFEASKQGMWVFLVTEVLMFGGLFVAYSIFRGLYPDMYHASHEFLDKVMGAINTVILITSSLTMVLAVGAAQRGQKDKIILYLVLTFLCACGFLVVKYFEYTHKFHLGLLPGGHFGQPIGAPLEGGAAHEAELAKVAELIKLHPKAPLFFSLYFCMTGLHGIHVLIGMGLMIWLMIRTMRDEFSPSFYTPVELVGFYWHFVDLVWIYLFPLLYLIG